MSDIDDLVNQAMEQWDKETNGGETDPAFAGEVDQAIDELVEGLKPGEVETLLAERNPLIFVEEKPVEGFILTCAKCGRSVNITKDNAGDFISAFRWGVKPEILKDFTNNTLGVYDIEDDCGPIITCPCGNNSIEIPPFKPIKSNPADYREPGEDDDPDLPD